MGEVAGQSQGPTGGLLPPENCGVCDVKKTDNAQNWNVFTFTGQGFFFFFGSWSREVKQTNTNDCKTAPCNLQGHGKIPALRMLQEPRGGSGTFRVKRCCGKHPKARGGPTWTGAGAHCGQSEFMAVGSGRLVAQALRCMALRA